MLGVLPVLGVLGVLGCLGAWGQTSTVQGFRASGLYRA